ncbi:hypothetical protein EPUL_004198, partial [Erysiphe pulchra]
MRLVTLFLILNIQLSYIHDLSAQARLVPKGYECGNIFFTDSEVNEALSLAKAALDEGHNFPQRYYGKIYSDTKFKEYFIWPIKPWTTYRVVFTRDSNEAVDVVAKITIDNDYAKCIRRGSSHIEPSPLEPVIANGYLCGQTFFTDEIIRQSLAIAQFMFHKKNKFPCPYVGSLFPRNSGFLMWPIMKEKNLYYSGKVHIGPYYLILSKELLFVEVVIKGFSKNFLRCIRSRQAPKAPDSDPHSKLFVPPPKTGFICGKTFFDDKVLQDGVEIAKKQASNVKKSQFPVKYFGPPYYEHSLIWPLMKDGSLYKRGKIVAYRLILKPDYKIIGVAVWYQGELKACDRKTIKTKKKHDTSDYQCIKHRFSHQQLVTAAEEACTRMSLAKKNMYPASYEGPEFNSKGPYYTFPVLQNDIFRHRNVGRNRVVINANCEVVGALTTLNVFNSEDNNNEFQKSGKAGFILWLSYDQFTTFRVVFTRGSNEAIDVVAKTTTDDYVKCIRRGSSHIEPSHLEPLVPNGYLCGHKFFTDEIIHQSHTLAQAKVQEKTKYPSPYVGSLFPENSGYLIWPIVRGDKLFKYGMTYVGTYYLILNKEREIVEVVVRGYNNNFLRCIRSRQAPKAPESDPHSK